MSKVVKKVGRAIGKVVEGVKKVVSKTFAEVKRFAKSDIGKALIIAATVYFGGAALSGAMSSTAGSSALTGISNAWTSLSTAGSQALAGNFANAASALGTGIQGGAAVAGEAGLMTSGVGGTAASFAPVESLAPTSVGTTSGASSAALSPAAPEAALNAGAPNLTKPAADAASKGFFSSDVAKYGAITAGTQLAGGLIQGAGQQKALEDQRRYEQQLFEQQNQRYANSVSDFGQRASADAAIMASRGQNISPAAPAAQAANRYQPAVPPVFAGGPAQIGMINRAATGAPIYNPYYPRG
jgi:hypothetical protein